MASLPDFLRLLREQTIVTLPDKPADVVKRLQAYRAAYDTRKNKTANAANKDLLAGLVWAHAHHDDLAPAVASLTDAQRHTLLNAFGLDLTILQSNPRWPTILARHIVIHCDPGSTPVKKAPSAADSAGGGAPLPPSDGQRGASRGGRARRALLADSSGAGTITDRNSVGFSLPADSVGSLGHGSTGSLPPGLISKDPDWSCPVSDDDLEDRDDAPPPSGLAAQRVCDARRPRSSKRRRGKRSGSQSESSSSGSSSSGASLSSESGDIGPITAGGGGTSLALTRAPPPCRLLPDLAGRRRWLHPPCHARGRRVAVSVARAVMQDSPRGGVHPLGLSRVP